MEKQGAENQEEIKNLLDERRKDYRQLKCNHRIATCIKSPRSPKRQNQYCKNQKSNLEDAFPKLHLTVDFKNAKRCKQLKLRGMNGTEAISKHTIREKRS